VAKALANQASVDTRANRPGATVPLTPDRCFPSKRAAVLDVLILDDPLPAYGIDVDVEGGRVTQGEVVDVGSQREATERIARRVSGVSEVRNRLEVSIPVSAEEIAEHVRDAIAVDAIVDADGITVTGRDNVVTLSGSVRSGDDRDAAVAAAARRPGVVGVRDEVRVVA
jgi:osmotically-inducible protein OsmY